MAALVDRRDGADAVMKVVIEHPSRTWADALERLLAPRWDIDVVTAHTKASWVRHAVVTHQADILITHATPPRESFEERVRDVVGQVPGLGIVVISDSRDPDLLDAAIRSGVRGWVEPTCSVEHLVKAMHGVRQGETWYPPALMTPVLDALLDADGGREEQSAVLAPLSEREMEILSLLAQGLTRRQIADRLTVSPHTVRTHINNLLRKLDVHSVLAAVSIARQAGVPEPGRRP